MRGPHRIQANKVGRIAPDGKLISVVRTALPQETRDTQKVASLPREFVSECGVHRKPRIRYFLVVESQLRQAVGPEPTPGGFIKGQARIEAASRRDRIETQGLTLLGFEGIIVHLSATQKLTVDHNRKGRNFLSRFRQVVR